MSSGQGFDPAIALIEHHVVGTLLKQGRLGTFLGETPRWQADLEEGHMQIAGIDFDVDLLGIEQQGTFVWAWALDGLPDRATSTARALHGVGEQLSVRELTTAQQPGGDFDGFRAALIGCGVAKADAYFLATNEETRYAFLLRHPELAKQPTPVAHLPEAWQSARREVPFDHKRAFEHFQQSPLPGVTVTEEPTGYRLDGPDTAVRLTLD